MKTTCIPTWSRSLLTGIASCISFLATAQDCSIFYPLKEGVKLEYTLYGNKDKVEGVQTQEITGVESTPDGLHAQMHINFRDQKGKEVYEMDYGFLCAGDVVRIDFQSLMSGPMLQQNPDVQAEITGTDIEWPNNLSVGQELPDANVSMKMNMGGISMTMEMDITARKVEKKETVTTPAGTFDCYVVYSETHSKMMMANQTFPSRTWLAEGVGMVKNESYNKNGKLTNYMLLTAKSL